MFGVLLTGECVFASGTLPAGPEADAGRMAERSGGDGRGAEGDRRLHTANIIPVPMLTRTL